jgi:predicted dehydrogenase
MKKPVSIVLVGISGMGGVYLSALLENRDSGRFSLAGAVDPFPERSLRLAELKTFGVPVFESLEDFYSRMGADLAIISSPIQFHCAQTRLALSRGSHVLCEKPPAATIQEVREMIEARDRAGKWVSIGYQWSFSQAIQSLKRDIIKGRYGLPRRLKCLYLWPRDEAYYLRNDWAGRKRDAAGRWVLDSPANNAMAHDLHNMFYVLGRTKETSFLPIRVEAELYRGYSIENFDTAAIRCFTAQDVEILFYVSHATDIDTGPVFSYELTDGTISSSGRNASIVSESGSRRKDYGNPDREPLRKIWQAVRAVDGVELPSCGLEAAMSQTLCLNGAQESMAKVEPFSPSLLDIRGEPGKRSIVVRGLAETLKSCYERNLLPSDLGAIWSRKGRVIDLTGYRHFPSGREVS